MLLNILNNTFGCITSGSISMSGRILTIQTAFPGDAILTLPALQKIKELNPNSKIDVVAINSTKNIFEASAVVDKVFLLDKRGKHKSLISLFNFSKQLKQNQYSKVYSFHRSFRSALLVKFIGAESYGYSTASCAFLYTHKIQYQSDAHEVKRNLNIATEGEFNGNWKIAPIMQSNDELNFSFGEGKSIIALAPGSVWETKKLPLSKFKVITQKLIKLGYYILVIGGIDDKEICDEIASISHEKCKSIAGEYSITETTEILKQCLALICNDSAPTHMAMAAGIAAITVYCSTIPKFGFYPYLYNSQIVSIENLDCKPCGIHGHVKCPKNNFRCGQEISTDEVINKINLILE